MVKDKESSRFDKEDKKEKKEKKDHKIEIEGFVSKGKSEKIKKQIERKGGKNVEVITIKEFKNGDKRESFIYEKEKPVKIANSKDFQSHGEYVD